MASVPPPIRIRQLPSNWMVARVRPSAAGAELFHHSGYTGEFISVTSTEDEISIVCEQGPANLHRLQPFCDPETIEPDWCLFGVVGPLDFEWIGILQKITNAMAEQDISVFCLSTFDTDYILVKQSKAEAARAAFLHHRIQMLN